MSDPSNHPFDAAILLQAEGEGRFQGQLTADYANMIGPFGGAIAAVMLNAFLLDSRRLGNPVSTTVNFAGPIADAPFVIVVRETRRNRRTQHWYAELEQDGQVAVSATAVFADRHSTWRDTELSAPNIEPPAVPVKLPLDRMPVWVRQYEMDFLRGGFNPGGTPNESSETVLRVRDNPPRPLDYASLMAMTDVFFPRVFQRRGRPGPSGTISLTTYFHADAEALALQGDQPLLSAARGQCYHDGYFDQSAQLWSSEGKLLATSSQLVYFKDS